MKLKQRIQTGFTLIELVIVIVIIGILAAVAVPLFSGVTDDAKAANADAVVSSINSAISAQKALCLNPSKASTAACPTTFSCTNVVGKETAAPTTAQAIKVDVTIAAADGTADTYTCSTANKTITYNETTTTKFTSSAKLAF